MKISDFYSYIDSFSPFSSALPYDNVGLLVGDGESEVKKALLTLDITINAVEFAAKNDCELIISHHPVIFDPITSVTAGSVPYALARNGIGAICAHTNLDRANGGINDVLAEKAGMRNTEILCPNDPEMIGRIGDIDSVPVREYVEKMKKVLENENIIYVDSGKPVRRLAVISGSGGNDMEKVIAAGADTLLTGEAKYHHMIMAENAGFNLIIAGHYATENIIIPVLQQKLSARFPDIDFLTRGVF